MDDEHEQLATEGTRAVVDGVNAVGGVNAGGAIEAGGRRASEAPYPNGAAHAVGYIGLANNFDDDRNDCGGVACAARVADVGSGDSDARATHAALFGV